MNKPEPPVNFRATDEDRKIIAELVSRLGLNVTSVLKLALRRLHAEESKRHTDPPKAASEKSSRKRSPSTKA